MKSYNANPVLPRRHKNEHWSESATFEECWYITHRWFQRVPISFSLVKHTHNHLTALFPGLPRWAATRKVKPMWILLKQESGSGIRWAICKSAPHIRQITTPAPHHSVLYGPDALLAAQPTASKHWRHKHWRLSQNEFKNIIYDYLTFLKNNSPTTVEHFNYLIFHKIPWAENQLPLPPLAV